MTTSTAPATDPPSADVTGDVPVADAPPPGRGARRFHVASLAGGAVALAVLAWLATRGASALFDTPRFADFYDAQARSLFHGRWDMPADVVSFERFNIDGHFYTYFGPTPALLRMPILLLTGALDGRLSRVSMVLASAVLLLGVARLSWLARRSVRGDGPVSRGEAIVAAAIVAVAGLGTVAPYLAGWTAVYHEAIQWGVAFALVSYGALVAWMLDRRARDLVVASAAAVLSVLARGSVGFGPISAIGLVLLAQVWGALREWRAGRGVAWPVLAGLAAAVLVPIALYGYVNAAKFGAPFAAPPFGKQDILAHDWQPRVAAMAANGGSLFGIGYVPTILYHYLRPDGVVFDRLFPWVLMRLPTRVFGGEVFEALRPTTSVTTASPLALAIATLGGVIAVARRALRTTWFAPVVGTLVGSLGAVSLAFVDLRYQGDFIPLLVVPGVVGAWVVVDWLAGRSRAVVSGVVALAVVLGAWSVWVNVTTAFVYQRAQTVFGTVDDRASLVELQLDVQDLLGGGLPSRVSAGDTPPADGRAGDLFALTDCAGVYRHDGSSWQLAEQTPATGSYRLRLDVDPEAAGRQPLLSSVDDLGTTVVWARALPGDRVGFDYQWEPRDASTSFRVDKSLGEVARGSDGSVDVAADFDFRDGFTPYLALRVDGALLYDGTITALHGPMQVGVQHTLPGATELAGTVRARPAATPLCDHLVRLGLHVPRSAGAAGGAG